MTSQRLEISPSNRHNVPTPTLFADENLINDLAALDALWNPAPNPYHKDPLGWVHNIAHSETWSKQDEIYLSVRDNRYTTVRSCHGPGKSYTAAQVVAWWLDTQPDPFAITSAPTSHQVRTILWREISRAKKNAELPGKITRGQVPEWRINDELVAFGRKPADYLDPVTASSAFQGIHATSLLVVLDEGSGIPDWLADACETLITNEDSRMLIIGNPDNPLSYFARSHRPGSDWHKIKIAAKDTPAFTGEKVSQTLAKKLTSKIWVEERAKRWGVNSPMYKAKVDAEFPEVTDDTVFTPAMISLCIANDRSRYVTAQSKGRYGFDVARLGTDESVVYLNRNGYIRAVSRWSKADTMESVGRYRRLVGENPSKHIQPGVIDANGLGAGVYDRLKELGYPVIPFNGGEKAYNFNRFKNRRSETYWNLREGMEEGLIDLEELDEDLIAELYEVHFKINSAGQIQLEQKEDIAQRLGRSPDRADAFVMSTVTTAGPQPSKQETLGRQESPNVPTDAEAYDPEYRHNHNTDFSRGRATSTSEPDDLVSDLNTLEF